MKMEVSLEGVSWVVAAALGVVALIGIVLLAWIGGELHYRNCVTDAEYRYPVPTGMGAGTGSPMARTVRSEAIDGCSRWP
jgi:hypothetical protein